MYDVCVFLGADKKFHRMLKPLLRARNNVLQTYQTISQSVYIEPSGKSVAIFARLI